MRFVTGYLRPVLFAILSFLVLTASLFLYWRSYSNKELISYFIYPYSDIPLKTYLAYWAPIMHLNHSLFVQYFWFLEGIFTGDWAIFNQLPVEAFLPATLIIIVGSILLTFLFVRISEIWQAGIIVKKGKNYGFLKYAGVPVAASMPVIIYYLMLTAGNLLGYNFYQIFGSGSGLQILSQINVGGGYFSFVGQDFYNIGFGLNSAGNPILNAMLGGNAGNLAILIGKLLPPILSVSLLLTVVFLEVRGSIWRKYLGNYRIMEENSGDGEKIDREFNLTIRKIFGNKVLKRAPLLVLLIIVADIYSESVLGYTLGLGYWYPSIILGNHIYIMVGYLVWPRVYLTLTYGLIWILGSFIASVIRLHMGSNGEDSTLLMEPVYVGGPTIIQVKE